MTTTNKEKSSRSIYLRCTPTLWRAIAQAALDKEQSRTQFVIEAVEQALLQEKLRIKFMEGLDTYQS